MPYITKTVLNIFYADDLWVQGKYKITAKGWSDFCLF